MTNILKIRTILKKIDNPRFCYSIPPRQGKTLLQEFRRKSMNCSDSPFKDDEIDMLRTMFESGALSREELIKIITIKIK